MAKKSAIENNQRKIRMAKKFSSRRKRLLEVANNDKLPMEERFEARIKLAALPRVRDFRGLDPKSFDGRGNYALGVKEHIIFPEIDYDKAEAQLGLDIVVCTTAKTDAEAQALLRAFNFPFRQ